MKDTDLAYIAGYFDGEGCITVWRRKPQYSSVSVRHVLYIQISSTDEAGLRWINSMFKGKLLYKHAGPTHVNSADAWKWILSCKKAAEVLSLILPYLKLKRAEAELAILLQKDMHDHLHARYTGGPGRPRLTQSRLDYRDTLMNKIKALKKSYKRYQGKKRGP